MNCFKNHFEKSVFVRYIFAFFSFAKLEKNKNKYKEVWAGPFKKYLLRHRINVSTVPNICDQIWRNFANFAKIKKSWAIFGRIVWYSGKILTYFGKLHMLMGIF